MRPLLLTLAGLGLCLGASAQGPEWSYAGGPFASGYVFAAHPSGAVFSVGGDHLLISWDHGRTWSQRSATPVAPHALHLLGGDGMLALGSTGVIRSHDLGRTWVSAGLDGVALQFLALDPNGPWYAAVGRQLYRSEDEGATWEPRTFDFPQMGERFLALAVTEDGSVVVTWGGDVANLSRSTDGGLSWEEVDALPFTLGTPLVRAADGALLLSSYDPTDGCGLPHPAEGVYESVDGGASWETIYSGAATGAARTTTGALIVGRPGG